MNENPKPKNPSEVFVSTLTESQTALRGYCQASLGHNEVPKEVEQRANIVSWKKREKWNPETPFHPWVITVAKFEVLGLILDPDRRA
ncbi:MAG: hypothetical protein P8L49_10505 [Opitutaceae bacterium]|nr:hypothetical protein [Opitutaceae bacterium]